MPDNIDESEMYFSGFGENQIDVGAPDEMFDEAHQRINGTKRLLEAYQKLFAKLTRDAEEQRRRAGRTPPTKASLPPVTAVVSPPPQEVQPTAGDAPTIQGAPDLAIPSEDVVCFYTDPQSSRPLVNAREPSPTAYDPLNPISPDDIINLLAAPPADFDAFRRRLETNTPEPGERHPTHAASTAKTPEKAGEPVDLFTGNFVLSTVDLTVPTPFIPIAMARSYRSGLPYYGPLGFGWDHVYNVYLRPLNDGGFALWTGQLREVHFRSTGSGLEPEAGFGGRMERMPGPTDVFSVQFAGGNQWLFERPVGWSDVERIPLVAIRDRHGNSLHLTYGSIDRVESVLDDAGRGLLFTYGSCDLLESVTDHKKLREVRYQHDPEIEHLVRVVLPVTSQYPKGLRMTYEYASYHPHPAMRHNIVRIFDAEDRLTVENEYAGPDAGWEFNTVARQRTAGFEYEFGYEQIQYVASDPNNADVLASRTLLRSPDGSLHTYTFNYRGDLLDHRFRLNRDGSFRVVASHWRYDAEGNLIEAVGPDGLRTIYTFDSSNPDPCARHNLLQVQLAAALPGSVPSRIVFEAQYDPRFQLPIRTKNESGAATQFAYDFDVTPFGSSGRLRQVELPAVTGADGLTQQSVLTFEHNPQGQVTAATTGEGCRTEFRYLSGGMIDGFLSTVGLDPSGANLVTRTQYDGAGFPKTVEAPGGRTSGLVHNALGQVEEITAPAIAGQDAKVRRWFDDSGSVVRVERPSGSYAGLLAGTSIADTYERDEAGNLRRMIAAGNTIDRTEWLYCVDHEGRVVSAWDPLGVRMEREYGEDGSLLSETAAASEIERQKISYFYDRAGRLRRVVDSKGGETQIEPDVWGRPHKITLPKGAVRTLRYGVNDQLIEELLEDPSGEKMIPRQHQTYEYDRRGRLTFATQFSFRDESTIPVPLKTRYLYDKDDRVREVTLPRGAAHTFAFDAAGRPSEETDVHGNVCQFGYDATGDLTQVTLVDSVGSVTRTRPSRFTFDVRGRLKRTEFLDAVATFEYDDRDMPIEQLAPNGVASRLEFDAHGQVIVRVVDPGALSLRSAYEYDLNGRLSRYVDPTGKVTAWGRDTLGRVTFLTPPDGTTWKYFFDDKARTTRQQTPAGNNVAYELTDASGRLVKVTSSAATGQKAVAPQEFAFDCLDRLVRASAGTDSVQRQYDSLGRLIEETARGKTVRMEYDDTIGSADLIYPDGRRERTESNPAGQPTRIVLVTPGALGGGSGDVLLEITYSTAGRPVNVIYGNGVEGHLVHDDHDRLIRIEYQKGGVLLDSCRLRYDENGHRAVVQYLGVPPLNLVHSFDGNERLVEARSGFQFAPLPDVTAPAAQVADVAAAQIAAAAAPGIAFTLDDADTRTKVTGLNGGAPNETYLSGPDHRLTAVGANTISYNADGHRTGDARYEYDLDALNRVRRVRDRATKVTLAELRYDALSRVATGTTDGEEFERWFVGSTQIHEVSGPAPGIARQHSSHPLWPSPFCVVDAKGQSYIHQDEGWSTMCLTDASGAVLERHRYDVFGASAIFGADGVTRLTALRTEPMWRGMPALGTTRLFSTPRRLYDPEAGVFTSRDPLLYANSSSPYSYAAHNPVDFGDPTGLDKSPLGEKGHSIAPPPPVSNVSNDTLYLRPGFWQIYQNAKQEEQQANPNLHRVYEGKIAAPFAYLEEFLVRPILNIPHSVVNKAIKAGEHIARGHLWAEQDESAEAWAERLEAVADLALAFLDVTSFLEGGGGREGAPVGGRKGARTAEIPSGAPQDYVPDLSHVTGKGAAARNAAIESAIEQDLPNLKLTYPPKYNPFIRTGVAQEGAGTQIGKARFSNRLDLNDALVHEELHQRWWMRGKTSPHHPPLAADIKPWDFFHYTVDRYLRFRGWRPAIKNSERRALERAGGGT
jgi:RHS repeat-associated protein